MNISGVICSFFIVGVFVIFLYLLLLKDQKRKNTYVKIDLNNRSFYCIRCGILAKRVDARGQCERCSPVKR